MEVTRTEIEDLTLEFEHHSGDYQWVSENVDYLHDVIGRAVTYQQIAVSAIELLNAIFPYLIICDDYRRWEPILLEALAHAQNLKDNEFQMQIWAELGQNYLQFGQRKEAYEAFSMASERAEDFNAPKIELLGKIGQLRIHAFFDRGHFNDLVDEILNTARKINDPTLHAKAHSALGIAYTLRMETQKGLGHAQVAYAWWHKLNNKAQKADAALTMFEACRLAERLEQASRFLKLAEKSFDDNEPAHRLGIYAYNAGILYFSQWEDFEKAAQWLEIALDNFIKLEFPYFTGGAHHALALAQIKLQKFDEAKSNLQAALILWRKLKNQYEKANACYALGFLAFQQKQYPRSVRWYQRALKLCEKVPDSLMLQDLLRNINEDMANVKID